MSEFEKWKQKSKLYEILSRDIQLYGSANCNEGDLQSIFEAGQKHPEWIRATERLPTKNDGKVEEWRFGKFVKIIGVERETGEVRSGIFFINGNRNPETIWFSKWQPLPEA